ATFQRAWQSGQALTLDATIALAGTVEVASAANDPAPRLSPREQDVARLAAQGMTNQQIAAELGMSVRTAETHMRNVLRKLGLASRRDLVVSGRGLRDAGREGT